MTELGDTCV